MKHWERKGEIPEKIEHSYPTTFKEAKKYYGAKDVLMIK